MLSVTVLFLQKSFLAIESHEELFFEDFGFEYSYVWFEHK